MRSHAGVAAQMFSALGRKRHQYRGDLDLGDQNQRIDRCCLCRACGADFAFLVRPGQPVGLNRAATQAFRKLRFAAKPGGGDWTLMPISIGAPRLLLRRLREVMAERESAQARLDKVVVLIASNMVAEVCSLYLRRRDGSLELFATEGLNREAVHNTHLKPGEGLVGLIAEHGRADAVRRRPDPSRLLLPAGDRRGDLPRLPRRADPARRPHHRRAHGAEPHPASLQRRGGRGAADHRHGARRDDRLGRARGRATIRARRRAASRAPASPASASPKAWRSAMWCCTSRASWSPS